MDNVYDFSQRGSSDASLVAAEIRSRLERYDIEQGELARRCGMSSSTLSRRLRKSPGSITMDELSAVAHVLGTTPEGLISDARHAPPPPSPGGGAAEPPAGIEPATYSRAVTERRRAEGIERLNPFGAMIARMAPPPARDGLHVA